MAESKIFNIDAVLARVFSWGIRITGFAYALAVSVAFLTDKSIGADETAYPSGVLAFLKGLATLEPNSWAYAGTLSLIGTPIAAVFASLRYFTAHKETKYTRMIYVVLAVFALSLLSGLLFGLEVDQ